MGTEVSKVKQILRGQMRQALAELSDQERAWSDGELIQRFLDHPKLAQAQTVMLYYGVGHEIRTEGLIQTLLDQGKTVCLPKCLPENQMEARAITSLEDLYSTGFFDYLDQGAVLAVEWSENIEEALPQPHITVDIALEEGDRRTITVTGDERFS